MNVYAGMMVVVNDQNKAYILKQQIADGYNIDTEKEIVKNGLVYDKSTDNPIPANPTDINNWVPVGTDFSGDISDLSDRVDDIETDVENLTAKLNVSNVSGLGVDDNNALSVKLVADSDNFINGLVATENGLAAASYQLKKRETGVDDAYAAQYDFTTFTPNGSVVTTINIPKDQVLKSAEILSVTEENLPYTGAKVGDKYIKFEFQNNNTPQYLAVQDLVDVYTAGDYIQISDSNVISLNALKLTLDLSENWNLEEH